MATVEAMYLNGAPMLLADCETVGDMMAKIAVSRERFATQIVIIDPTNGRHMAADDIQIPKVEFVILNEDPEMDIESCKLSLRLHAAQADDATCSRLLDTLEMRHPEEDGAASTLSDVLLAKKSNWSVAAQTILRLGVSAIPAIDGAVKADRVDIVKYLVPDWMELSGTVVGAFQLTRACICQSMELVRTLLDLGAAADDNLNWIGGLLGLLCSKGSADKVKLLLDAGCETNRNTYYGGPRFFHDVERHDNSLKMLRNAGADVSSEREEEGWSPLLWASSFGHTSTAKILLDAGADVNSETKCGHTALAEASARGHAALVKVLLDAGADGNRLDNALCFASSRGHADVVKILLDAGADANSKSYDGKTALSHACACRYDDIVKLLLDAGADVTHKTEMGHKRGRST